MEVIYLDEDLMERMCHKLATGFFAAIHEPIPDFRERDASLLNSALNAPRHTFGGQDLYPTLLRKAVILYYSLNKNHPFPNGNKRIATVALIVFLYVNGYILLIPPEELLQKTIEIASAPASKRDEIIASTESWLGQYLYTIEEGTGLLKHN